MWHYATSRCKSIWKGNETKILLVHGWESNASRWKKTLPHLQKSGSTIIAIDGPAHGLSSGKEFSIPQYAAFINIAVENFKPQYLIGHSIGGKTCLYYQSVYQSTLIQKMVILGAPSDFNIILNNYIVMLSLNQKIAIRLKNYYLEHHKLNIDHFTGKLFASKINTKGLIAHDIDDTVVAFTEGKKPPLTKETMERSASSSCFLTVFRSWPSNTFLHIEMPLIPAFE